MSFFTKNDVEYFKEGLLNEFSCMIIFSQSVVSSVDWVNELNASVIVNTKRDQKSVV